MPRRFPPIRFLTVLSLVTLLSLAVRPSLAQDDPEFAKGNSLVTTTLISDSTTLQPTRSPATRSARIGIHVKIEPGWHIYWKNSGEAAIPTSVSWTLPDGWWASELRWPLPMKFIERGNIVTYGYEGEVLLIADLFSPEVVPDRDIATKLSARVEWLVCKDICVPGGRQVSLLLPFSTERPLSPSSSYDLFEKYEALTPRPLDDARLKPGLNLVVSGGRSITLTVSRIKLKVSIADAFQIFPDSVGGSTFGAARGELLAGDVIRLVQPLNSAEGTVSGVLALSGKALGQKDDIGITWKSEVQPGGTLDASGETLNFRVVSHDVPLVREMPAPVMGAASNSTSLLFALLFAFFGGMILNLMPCVLPVLSLKVFGLIEVIQENKKDAISSAVFYAAGILVTILSLAFATITFQQIGYSVGWGFQFQYPEFVLALLVIVFVLSLGFFDLYALHTPGVQGLNNAVSQARGKNSRHFFDGILATLLSTPCTAPFLGTALAFAFTQSPIVIVSIFFAVGAGLALPYILVVLIPGLHRILPQPGDWMNRIRELMGFLLLGTVIWLLYVLSHLREESTAPALLLLLLIFALFWFRRAFKLRGALASCGMFALATGAAYALWTPLTTLTIPDTSQGGTWEHFTPALVEELQNEGRTAFLDFTAEWCITCKFNERFVLSTRPIQEAFRAANVAMVKGDWTNGDHTVANAIRGYGGEGVPLYVVLGPKGKRVLPSVITPGMVIEALKAVSG